MTDKSHIHVLSPALGSLRAISYRISSTSLNQLPRTASQCAASLWDCREILSLPSESAPQNKEICLVVHRFKTALSALLQDRTIGGRWAGVVMAKAAVEAGGVEVLSKSNGWIRGLIAILKKSDPPMTKVLAVITITRMFMLTWDHTNLVRELTTPNLPAFVSACLTMIVSDRCSVEELESVLEAFTCLIPKHPTIFRTVESRLRTILLQILSATDFSDADNFLYTSNHCHLARRVLVLLPFCAPKQGSADEWTKSLGSVLFAAHVVCDQLFRSVIENWKSSSGISATHKASIASDGPSQVAPDGIGLPGWSGIPAGSARLTSLLQLMQLHIRETTSDAVAIPIGGIVDLLTRLSSVARPSDRSNKNVRANNQIPKDERDSLFDNLPQIHAAGLELLCEMVVRIGPGISSLDFQILEIVENIFEVESHAIGIRAITYELLTNVLEESGISLTKQDQGLFSAVLKSCCDDVLPANEKATNAAGAIFMSTTANSSPSSAKVGSDFSVQHARLNDAAASLLPATLTKLTSEVLSPKLRAQIERTAILTNNKEALLAGVMNSSVVNGRAQVSLLPFLARNFPESIEVEALLRPRMPLVNRLSRAEESKMEDEESSEESESELVEHLEVRIPDQNDLALGEVSNVSMADIGVSTPSAADQDAASAQIAREEAADPAAEHHGHVVLSPDDELSGKRAAEDNEDSDVVSTKRIRQDVDNSTEMLQEDHIVHSSTTESSQVLEEARQITAVSRVPARNRPAEGGVDSDDSDFEMPPLTMEPDTDPEDEE